MSAVIRLAAQRGGGQAPVCEDGEDARRRLMRRVAALAAVRDWLETQARVVEYWRDLVADAGGDLGEDAELVAALDAHAAFLNGVAGRT